MQCSGSLENSIFMIRTRGVSSFSVSLNLVENLDSLLGFQRGLVLNDSK